MITTQLSFIADALGLLSGIALVIPPAKDQLRRRKMDAMERIGDTNLAVNKVAKQVWDIQRTEARRFSRADTLLLLAGAVLLTLSFLISMISQVI